MTVQLDTLQTELESLVGPAHCRPATPADVVDGVPPRWVVEPGDAEEVAAVLRLADGAGLRVAPRGGGTKTGWGHPPTGIDCVLALHRLDAVLEHAWADMTATVEAGCTVAAFQAALAEHGQRLACDSLWPDRATIGGILATNDSGALRQRFGALRDLIIGVTVALPNGVLAKSGGKVVKNVAGYDLPKLMTGAVGTLGVIVQATFRLYPLPAASRTFTVTAPTVAPLAALLGAVRDSVLVPTGLQLRAATAVPPALDIRFESIGEALGTQVDALRRLAADAGCADTLADAPPEVWTARQDLWDGDPPGAICKVTVQPAQLGALGGMVERAVAPAGGAWRLVGQSVGTVWLRLDAPAVGTLPAVVAALRATVGREGGSLVVLHAPPDLKAQIDIWGADGDALPLMRRVKAQFDPNNILNPGRFVGGI